MPCRSREFCKWLYKLTIQQTSRPIAGNRLRYNADWLVAYDDLLVDAKPFVVSASG